MMSPMTMPMLGEDDPHKARRQAIAQLLAQQAPQDPGNAMGAAAQGANQMAQALLAQRLQQLGAPTGPTMRPDPTVAGPRAGTGFPLTPG